MNCRRRAGSDRRPEREASNHRHPLVAAILALPADQREVFVLSRVAGLTYSQISDHLGLSVEAVQASLAAALLQLARGLDDGPM